MAYFCSALGGTALLLRSGPQESRCNVFGGICSDLQNQTTIVNTIIQWHNNRTGGVRGHLIPLSKERKEINYMTNAQDTLAPASQPCQWMGCTKGASWGTCGHGKCPLMSPTHLKSKNRKVACRFIVTWKGSTVARCEFSFVNLTLIQLNTLRWPTKALDARIQQFIHCCRLLQWHRLHRSSLSVSFLVFLLTGCVALDRKKKGMKRST